MRHAAQERNLAQVALRVRPAKAVSTTHRRSLKKTRRPLLGCSGRAGLAPKERQRCKLRRRRLCSRAAFIAVFRLCLRCRGNLITRPNPRGIRLFLPPASGMPSAWEPLHVRCEDLPGHPQAGQTEPRCQGLRISCTKHPSFRAAWSFRMISGVFRQ